jgi:hypothetical protein
MSDVWMLMCLPCCFSVILQLKILKLLFYPECFRIKSLAIILKPEGIMRELQQW